MATQTKDYYGTLGIKKTATADEIRKAFRKLARKYHPDVNPGDKKAEEKFKEISEANDILSDDKKRKVYDQFGFYSDNIDPAAAEAAARGGHAGAPHGYSSTSSSGRGGQEVPFDFGGFEVSRSYTYRVRPVPSTTILPRFPTVAVDSLAAPAVAGADALGAGVFCGADAALAPPPQAVRVASPSTAVPASRASRFIRAFSLIC